MEQMISKIYNSYIVSTWWWLAFEACLCGYLFGACGVSFAMVRPSEAAPQETPEMSKCLGLTGIYIGFI